jgi:acetylornithine deacetylase
MSFEAPLSRREALGAFAAVFGMALPRPSFSIPSSQTSRTALLSEVDDASDLALLRRMIQTRSYSGSGEEGALAELMIEEMKGLGLETRLIEVEPGRYDAVGWLRGSGGGTSLMLNGHLDTNPVGLGWTVDPLEGLVRDGMVYGIGVSNMKASCAAFFGAARSFVNASVQPRGDLVLAYVVGELQGGIGTLALLNEDIKADTFIVGEPTDLAIVTLHAASLTVEVSTLGVTRHLSKKEESVSAIDTMIRVVERIQSMSFSGPDDEELASVRRVNIGSMRAGLGREMHDWRPGQVPDFATIRMSVRYGPGQSESSVIADIESELAKLSREDPRVRTEVFSRKREELPPPRAFQVAREEPIVQATARAYRDSVGEKPLIGAVAPYRYYGSDASHLQHLAGMKGVVCGAGGKYNTMPDERVELPQFRAATRLYALTALEICG